MLGNCATGKLKMVIAPTITRMIEITMATMGRLMKNFDMRSPSLGFRRKGLGVHLHAGAHLLHALDHHALSWFQSVGNDPLAADTVADLDGPDAHFVLVIHLRDLIAALQFRDCALGDQQRILLHANGSADLGVSARAAEYFQD